MIVLYVFLYLSFKPWKPEEGSLADLVTALLTVKVKACGFNNVKPGDRKALKVGAETPCDLTVDRVKEESMVTDDLK